ncbi:MAG: hypothetical protein O7F73_14600 [Gammaproteobacteria bacterium]|nr:hypothetical protein [Gammaproteobacteria bacterium]
MSNAKSKKAPAKKTVARKSAAKKAAANKTAARKPETKMAVVSPENVRNVFLAGLGFYGKALDEAQNQIKENRSKLEQRRERASELFDELVKRGEKVESDTRKKLKELDLPELKMPELKLSDREESRAKLRARLDRARASFNTLRDAVSAKSEAR